MLIKKLILKNVGVFRDTQEFDLTGVTTEKPVILFGAGNGSGKTTVFESLMLCLYGISFFDKKIPRKDYEKYLRRKIHRFVGTPLSAESAQITVEFSYYHQGKINNYVVTREWLDEQGKILENLRITKDGTDLDSIENSQWQAFIDELIPRGISKLFFFDGEKVVKMAQENSEGAEIQRSFSSLLGLELIQQLQSDLRVSMMRKLGGKSGEVQAKFDSLSNEKQDTENKILGLKERLASILEDQKGLLNEIENLESKISKIGGGFAQARQQLLEKKSYLQTKIRLVEGNIEHLCSGLLPFCIIPRELKQLGKQLLEDQELVKKQFEKEIIDDVFDQIRKKINSVEFWNGTDKKIHSELLDKFESLLKNVQIKKEKLTEKGVINYSLHDTAILFEQIEKINNEIPKSLEKETLEYQKISEEMEKVETAIANAPKDDEIGPLISQLSGLQNNLGMLNNEIDHIQRQITQEQTMIKLLNSKIRNVLEQKYKNSGTQQQVDLAERIQEILDVYTEKLKGKKIELLENYLLEGLHILLHKDGLVDKVKIDKNSFEIHLFKQDGSEISKDFLSEGEKQMLAIALLWALAKTSGKPLPFIIDTPLARLDVEHRENLVSKFFPIASHQVVIFSTDSEIDEKYYPSIKPYVKKSYFMEYKSNVGKTKVAEGYFPGVLKKIAV